MFLVMLNPSIDQHLKIFNLLLSPSLQEYGSDHILEPIMEDIKRLEEVHITKVIYVAIMPLTRLVSLSV